MSIVLDGLLHALCKKRGKVDQSVLVFTRGVITHVEALASNTIIVHHIQNREEVTVAVDGGGCPLHRSSLVEQNVVVYTVLAGFENSFKSRRCQTCWRKRHRTGRREKHCGLSSGLCCQSLCWIVVSNGVGHRRCPSITDCGAGRLLRCEHRCSFSCVRSHLFVTIGTALV